MGYGAGGLGRTYSYIRYIFINAEYEYHALCSTAYEKNLHASLSDKLKISAYINAKKTRQKEKQLSLDASAVCSA